MINLVHRIVLTEECNLSCPHCFNSEVRQHKVMDADILLRFMKENSSELGTSTIKIMGGEPTLHPKVLDIIKEACNHYWRVELFTNGTKMKGIVSDPIITKFHFQRILTHTINGFTFNVNEFLSYKEYIDFVVLHFVIPLNNPENMLKKIEKCMELSPKVGFLISPDTQVNLFDDNTLNKYRQVWIEVITNVNPQFKKKGISFNYDHKLPICFYTQEMIDILHSFDVDTLPNNTTMCCGDQQIGLIDTNFDIYFCNQTRIKLGSLLNDNGDPKPLKEVVEMIQGGSKIKVEQIKNLSDKCRQCPVLASCKVGCYFNTLESIGDNNNEY